MFKPKSRNRTMTQLKKFKIPGLLASLGKTMCKVKWQSAYYQCRTYNEMEGENKMLYVKWGSLAKHVGRKKAAKDIMTDVKKKDWYYYKVCKHVCLSWS